MRNTTKFILVIAVLAVLFAAIGHRNTFASRPANAPLLEMAPWHSDSNVLLASDSGKFFIPPADSAFAAIVELHQGLPVGEYISMVNMTGIDVHHGVGVTILVDLDHGGSTSMTLAEKFGVLNIREIAPDTFIVTHEEPKEPLFPN